MFLDNFLILTLLKMFLLSYLIIQLCKSYKSQNLLKNLIY